MRFSGLGRRLEDAGHTEAVLTVEGPAVSVSGSIGVAIGLVLNELITNSRKHGAAGAETTEGSLLPSPSKDELDLEIVQPHVSLPESFFPEDFYRHGC